MVEQAPSVHCTAQERQVLDTIKLWPGIDATVRWDDQNGWSVRTPSQAAFRRYGETGRLSVADLQDAIRNEMHERFYNKPGAVLLSPLETLQRGPVYLMGINPGGNPREITRAIIDANPPAAGTSSYTHECWQGTCSALEGHCQHIRSNGRTLAGALVKHQRNMIRLAAAFGSTPSDIFSANAIFGRSTRFANLKIETGFSKSEWWEACWRVHQLFLSIVRPKFIVTLGYGESSSAFGLLMDVAGSSVPRQLAGEGPLDGRIFAARLPMGERDFLDTHVVGVPHPSYNAPSELLWEHLRELTEGSIEP